MKKGDKVIFTGTLKALDPGTIGVIDGIRGDWAVIAYPQNFGTNKVSYHSAKLGDLKFLG